MKSKWLSSVLVRQTRTTASPQFQVEHRQTPWRVLLLGTIFSSLLPGMVGAATMRLNWKDNSSNEAGFKIERLDGSSYVQIASVAANMLSYSDSNLADGKAYCYRVRSYNTVGASATTNASCTTTPMAIVTPPPPPPPPPPSTTPIEPTPINPTPTPIPVQPAGNLWSDYLVSMKIRSSDNDALGILFRYQDEENYYRFSWDAQNKSRRLEKRVGGVLHKLAQDTALYAANQKYALQISASGSDLKVVVDGKTIFSLKDTSLTKGTIGLYSFYNAGSYFDDVRVEDLLTGSTLLADDFNDGNRVGWTILDEGDDAGPSAWKVVNGSLAQTSNIGSTEDNGRLGTHALYTRGNWADYRMTLKLRSSDDDLLGVMFRVQDSNNYYRLTWQRATPGRQLWKRQNGVFKLLAADAVPYIQNQTYNVEVIAQGTSLKVNINGKAVFSLTDSSFPVGTIALYSAFNQGSYFDDVLVEELTAKTVLLWDDFTDGNLAGWKVFDESGTKLGPSNWSIVNGALAQRTNIGSETSGKPGTFMLY